MCYENRDAEFAAVCKERDELKRELAAERKRGYWMPQTLLGERVWDCSECKTLGSPHWKRCPVCEAKMEVK